MRICFIEDTLLHGGTQIWVTEAIRYCLEHSEDVTLLAPENSWVAEQVCKSRARIVSYDWENIVRQAPDYKKIWTDALKESDIALCTVHPPRGGFHCVVFAAECIQDGDLKTHLIAKTGTIVPEYKREFYQANEEIRSSVIAIAEFTKRYLIEHYRIPAEKVELIYQGVDVNRFQSSLEMRAEAKKRYPLPDRTELVIGCVGSFEERKGQVVLLEAVAQLAKDDLRSIHLMLVGNGPDEDYLRSLVKKMNLEQKVSFFPFTHQPAYVFERVDITVLPSIAKEGLPNVLLESMSMGTPVIASDFGGIPEVVIDGKTGVLVTPGDSRQLADAILDLWRRPAFCHEMGQDAVRFVQSDFDKNRQFARFLDFFTKVKSTI
ncbi:MAG: glycosyltransferase family 4 protein [Anaerolineaceae bacterium]|nr:glycosyltransferase family 4 protein [Anaerolineaceae bacterium]